MMIFSRYSRGVMPVSFEGTGKGKWILISAGERHAGDRDIRDGQKLPGVDDLG